MFKILVVDDAKEYQKIITRTLGDYDVTCAESAEEAGPLLCDNSFDLIIVDINLPKQDGYSFLTEVRSSVESLHTPIFCLTSRSDITDKVTAFSLGADDYVTKPFDPIELRARIDAKLRSAVRKKNKDLITSIGELEIDHARHRVVIDAKTEPKELDVTQTEFKILFSLSRRPGQVFSRDQLLAAAWGQNVTVLERVVDAHICLLRKKLGRYGHYIQAVTGVGYKLAIEPKQKKAL